MNTFATIYALGMAWGGLHTVWQIHTGRSVLDTDRAVVKVLPLTRQQMIQTLVFGSAVLWPALLVAILFNLWSRLSAWVHS